MKQIVKYTIFIEALVVVIFGCTWLTLKLIGDDCPIVILPIVMAIVFGCVLLSLIVAPIAEWFLN